VSAKKTLIFVPTYNEGENTPVMLARLRALKLDVDLLFVDDGSPDGTGEFLDGEAQDDPRLFVVHRPGKQGIGSAHKAGIAWAYDRGYQRLVTLDCDFSHTPEDIPRLLAASDGVDVVVGSRYLRRGSLPGWSLARRLLTHTGHLVTKVVLGIPQDATTAFRIYALDRIPRWEFEAVSSPGYSFFLESMFRLVRGGYRLREVDIVLPARTYGHSKMALSDVFQSVLRIQRLYLSTFLNPSRPVEDQGWDAYWNTKDTPTRAAYDVVATTYRNLVIKRRLNHFIFKHFPAGSRLLHAGCGSGQVDVDIARVMDLGALDLSAEALRLYRRHNPGVERLEHADLLAMPFEDESVDGVYNLGVIEHLDAGQIQGMLAEFQRVLRPGGKAVIFWPHRNSPSVAVLNTAHWLLNDVAGRNVRLHPPEISLLRSTDDARAIFQEARFDLIDFYYGVKDLFVQAVFVIRKGA
jgi:dolichol-phosphate mannosyltransferase